MRAWLKRIDFFHCIRQDDFGAQDAEAIAFCREKSAIADLFVGLVGMRRGWEPEDDNAKRSITEMEHDWARDAGRRRYIWVAPDNFPVPGNLHESAVKHKRQRTFRKRIMAAGERIVSQRGFESAATLAPEVTEQLFTHVVTSDLITLLRPEFTRWEGESTEDHAPAVSAAVERLADDEDVDLLALASDPSRIDVGDFESKLRVRTDQHEDASRMAQRASAEYWCHIGALAFLHDTHKALAAY